MIFYSMIYHNILSTPWCVVLPLHTEDAHALEKHKYERLFFSLGHRGGNITYSSVSNEYYNQELNPSLGNNSTSG